MLRTNEVVEEILFFPHIPKELRAGIDERLEVNRYRKKFRVLQQNLGSSTRTSMLPHAMGRVSSKPSLLWLCIKQNQGRIVLRIAEWLEEKTMSRKRSRPCSLLE